MKYFNISSKHQFDLNHHRTEMVENFFHYTVFLLILLAPIVGKGQELERVHQMSGDSDVLGQAIAVDSDGNEYVTGYFPNSATFGEAGDEITLTSAGNQDIFVAKYSPSGELLWAQRFGDDNSDLATDITVDQENNVYITGRYAGTLSFESSTVPDLIGESIGNVLVLKLNSDGEVIWARGFLGPSTAIANAITVDVDGNVLTTGRLEATLDFDPGVGVFELSTELIDDVFISKLDSDGNFVWAKAFSGPESNIGRGIATDQEGAVYTTGQFGGTADFDPGPGTFEIAAAGGDAIFIAKLDSNGELVWAKQSAGGGSEGRDLTLDGDGNILISGRFFGFQDFDPGTNQALLESEGSFDAFVLKLTNTGDFLWVNQIGGPFAENAMSIDVDNMGDVYTTGFFFDDAIVSFEQGPQTISSAGSRDIFLGKMNAEGNFLWAFRMGGTEGDNPSGIAVDGNGSIHTIGAFEETAEFGPGVTLTSAGEVDAFVTVHSQLVNTRDLPIGFEPMRIFPNPAEGTAILDWGTGVKAGILEVIDLQGRVVATKIVNTSPYRFDVSEFENSYHLIRFSESESDRVFLGKLVVSH